MCATVTHGRGWVGNLSLRPPLTQLLVGVVVGIVSYFVMAIVTKDETLNDVKQIILKK